MSSLSLSSCSDIFHPPFLTLFQLRLTVAQVPPTAVRLVPRLSQDTPKALWTSNHLAGRLQGQLHMLRAWSEEKHSIITTCLSRGAFSSLVLLLWCRHQHSMKPVTAGSASLRAWRGFLHSTKEALHSQPSPCAKISSRITSGQPFFLTPVVSGSHTPWCVLLLTATAQLGQAGPYCNFLLF